MSVPDGSPSPASDGWLRRGLSRLPLHVLNGLSVGLGVALVQAVVVLAAGQSAALMALTGAICASLADQPVVPRRTGRRVMMAGLGGTLATLVVVALRPHPMALGVALALIGFVAAYTLAWGPRAGPLSMVGVLAPVFAMAAPVEPGWQPVLVHAGWAFVGAGLYLGWSSVSSRWLQPVFRRLALAAVLGSLSGLLRARAERLGSGQVDPSRDLQLWIGQEAVLNERLQAARDLLYEEPANDARRHRQNSLLLLAIDLRDTLLASELDLNLIGRDAAGLRLQQALARQFEAIAEALDALRHALHRDADRPPVQLPGLDALRAAARARPGDAGPAPVPAAEASAFDAGGGAPGGDPGRGDIDRLLPLLEDRTRRMREDLERMQKLWDGLSPRTLGVPDWRSAELRLFLSGEDWSMAALRAQWHGHSPVLRHAVRWALAIAVAYYLALVLPWAAHPHWLVLSVAVVLRGSFEQTLARRDARITGTVIGCLLVLVLAESGGAGLSNLVFLVAVGVAHGYATLRYRVTSAAATLMALLQAHLAYPAGGFAVGERLADTVIGALLAWLFCYVLPAWERRLLPNAADRLLRALDALVRVGLRMPAQPEDPQLMARLGLARREAHDAIAALAAIAQRSSAEPRSRRLALPAIVDTLTQAQQLLSHLAAVRLMLTRRRDELDIGAAGAALASSAATIASLFAAARTALQGRAEAGAPLPGVASAAASSVGLPVLPTRTMDLPLTPDLRAWFDRRLRRTVAAAAELSSAALRLVHASDAPRPPSA